MDSVKHFPASLGLETESSEVPGSSKQTNHRDLPNDPQLICSRRGKSGRIANGESTLGCSRGTKSRYL